MNPTLKKLLIGISIFVGSIFALLIAFVIYVIADYEGMTEEEVKVYQEEKEARKLAKAEAQAQKEAEVQAQAEEEAQAEAERIAQEEAEAQAEEEARAQKEAEAEAKKEAEKQKKAQAKRDAEQERVYREYMSTFLASISNNMGGFSRALKNYHPYNMESKIEVGTYIGTMQVLLAEWNDKAHDVPEKFKDVHTLLDKSMNEYEIVFSQIAVAIDNYDVNKINSLATNMNQGTTYMNQANEKMAAIN